MAENLRREEKRFEPIIAYLITCDSAAKILQAYEKGIKTIGVSLDLHLSTTECFIKGEYVLIGDNELRIDQLREVREDERSIYILQGNSLSIAEVRARHYYKLVRTAQGHAPTIEIDGIHMHRVEGTFPELDAAAKVKLAGKLRNKTVLDTCMGLGYTAISALRMGASHVITVEKDENVYELARINPWSRALASNNVTTVKSDVIDYIARMNDGSIDVVIHDPPRFSMAGELYSSEFYQELHRVLRTGGRIVHYVGSPGKRRGRKIYVGVMKRMMETGFRVNWDSNLECVYGYKVERRHY